MCQLKNRKSVKFWHSWCHEAANQWDVFSRLDYCNGILSGMLLATIASLQRVQNAAARLVLGLSRSDHVRPALKELHWLPVIYRIKVKLALVMFTINTHQCPDYLTNSVHPYSNNDPARYRLRSATGTNYSVPCTRTTELSLWPGQSCGTVCRRQFVTRTVYSLLNADSNRTFLACVLMIDSVMPFRSGFAHEGH